MAATESTDLSVTRRTVVRAGVKLAYASPLVAASFKLAPLRGPPRTMPSAAARRNR